MKILNKFFMKSQKCLAIGGWTLFSAIVLFILFSGYTYQFHVDTTKTTEYAVYGMSILLLLISICYFSMAALSHNRERRTLQNI